MVRAGDTAPIMKCSPCKDKDSILILTRCPALLTDIGRKSWTATSYYREDYIEKLDGKKIGRKNI